ncbi:fungal-specific transcription factor domain-containing protein [Penicillium malachiteum]|nr:fungal-specific transcription factor domain-containing protein [Penicillium malachiteum]
MRYRYINELHDELANYRSKSHQPGSSEVHAEHSMNPPDQVFMGTSSSWAFGRRVLGMIHETLTGSPLFQDSGTLSFDQHVYDLKLDGNKANCSMDIFDISSLPPPIFSLHLINSFKFHVGELFFLFEESSFMNKLAAFQQNPAQIARSSPLWFCHYLLILAFGKSFVVQSTQSKSPSGGDHFIQAMQCMPDFTFFHGDPIEKIQVLCCAALYVQCVDCRSPAYRIVNSHPQ